MAGKRKVTDYLYDILDAAESADVPKSGEGRRPGGRQRAFKETEMGPIPVEWEVTTIGELVQDKVLRLQNGFPCGNHNQEGRGIPHLRPFNVDDEGNVSLDTIKYIETDRDVQRYLLAPGDVLFNNTNSEGLVGKTAYWDRPGRYVLSNHMTLVRVLDNDVVDSFYLSKYLHKLWYDRFYRGICRRHVNQASISLTRLKGVPVALPPFPEQRRIAHVLGTIQRAIAAQDKLIAAARELKRSLMQRLFTYGPGPEPAPTKQTETGEIPEHWEVVQLGSIGELTDGDWILKKHYTETGVRLLQVGDVGIGKFLAKSNRFISMDSALELKCTFLKPGNILISRMPDPIGRACFAPNLAYPMITAVDVSILAPDPSVVDSTFLLHALNSPLNFQQCARLATGATRQRVSGRNLETVRLPLPPLAEQGEIAHILSAADRRIEAEEQRKAVLQELFKTMLHQLMTGQVRV